MPDKVEVPNEKYKFPDAYTVEYVADCGESYFLDNCAVPRIPVFCDTCKETHYFILDSVIHRKWEWDRAEDQVDNELDFFGDGTVVEVESGVTSDDANVT